MKKIEARKKVKETLNHSRTRAKKAEARIRYSEVNKEVKRSIRNDRRNFVEDLARQAEEASGRGDAKELYSITRKLAGDRKIPERPVRDKSGELLTDQEEQRKRWADHFKELLNRPPPSELPDIQPANTPLQVSESKPSEAEIKRAIRQLKNGKAAGPDGIPSEAIKADLNTSTKMLYELFGKIWETNEIPDDWKEGYLIKLPKKGDLKECKNWRGIMLLSTAGKVLNRIILERLKVEVDKRLREEQAGFRKDRSCTDQIATLRIILEQSLEWNSPVYATFVDYEKAFDSVDREVLWKLLRHYGIPEKYITLIQKTYEKCTCRVIHNGVLSELFEMLTGVRQGCLLSPFLFLLVIDWIMRRTTEKHQDGIQWTLTTRLEDLDFADDIALLSHNHRSMQSKLTRLAKISMQTGLRISKSKTKVMRVNTKNADRIELDEDEIDEVEDFAYLRSNISKDGGSDQDIRVRIGKARTAFTILTPVWRSKVISRKTKLRLFNTNVKSVLLYGSETWRVTKANSAKLQTFINKCLRSIMGIHWPEVITNEELWTTTEQERINIQIRRRKWGWIGHTLRKTNCNVTKQALRWNPQGKRSRGRPRNSWRRTVDDEASKAGYTWRQIERIAQNRTRWRAVVSMDLCSMESERAPHQHENGYVKRNGFHSINVQGICNHEGMFTNVVARWPGSMHDSDVFRSSNICHHLENNHRSLDDGILLGDSGYACSPFLMTPYSNPRNAAQEAFNAAHTKTRVEIEKTFGRWKRQFHVLHSEIRMHPEKACLITEACACVQLDDAAVVELSALFLEAIGDVIKGTVTARGGNASVAASRLIHWPLSTSMANQSSNDPYNNAGDDEELLQPTFGVDGAKAPILTYRQQTLYDNPPMRIYVNRMKEEFSADVLAIYKKPNPGLNFTILVKFENEHSWDFFTMVFSLMKLTRES
ncbi:hypothetical protein ACROYT_G015662 [Oculina patagonica]